MIKSLRIGTKNFLHCLVAQITTSFQAIGELVLAESIAVREVRGRNHEIVAGFVDDITPTKRLLYFIGLSIKACERDLTRFSVTQFKAGTALEGDIRG